MSTGHQYHLDLLDLGFELVRGKNHWIYKHPCGATACMAKTASDHRSLLNSLMDARRELRRFGINPDHQAQDAPKPEKIVPEPAPIPDAPYEVIHVPERIEAPRPNPLLSDFGSRFWCVQLKCFGQWVCLEQQLAPDPDRALRQCLPETRDWYAKAAATGGARIEPKDP